MPDLLLDFATYFTTENLVQGDGIDVFRDFTPEEPDDLVSIFEYSGAPVQSFNAAVDRSIQIVVRSKSPTTAKQLANRLYNSLIFEDYIVQLTESRWSMIYVRQVPFKMKTDNLERVYYAFNLGITTYSD